MLCFVVLLFSLVCFCFIQAVVLYCCVCLFLFSFIVLCLILLYCYLVWFGLVSIMNVCCTVV